MKSLKFVAAGLVLLASVAAYSKIEGTYVLEFEGMGQMPAGADMPEITMTFSVDDEGKYSVVVVGPGAMGEEEEQTGEDVTVDENEFSFKIVNETPMGEMAQEWTGKVEDGELTGTMSMAAGEFNMDMEFTGTLKEEDSDSDDEAEEEAAEADAEM